MQKTPFILSSSASLSMVCMVSKVIIMKGMLWDTAKRGTRGEKHYPHTGEFCDSPRQREAFQGCVGETVEVQQEDTLLYPSFAITRGCS